jgi:hypothetical protein
VDEAFDKESEPYEEKDFVCHAYIPRGPFPDSSIEETAIEVKRVKIVLNG